MPLELGSRTAVLTGILTIDDAEPLATWLRTRGAAQTPARVHLGACTHLHTAVLQTLLSARVQISVPPADPFLRTWIAPLLDQVPHRTTRTGAGRTGASRAGAGRTGASMTRAAVAATTDGDVTADGHTKENRA